MAEPSRARSEACPRFRASLFAAAALRGEDPVSGLSSEFQPVRREHYVSSRTRPQPRHGGGFPGASWCTWTIRGWRIRIFPILPRTATIGSL